MRQTLRYLKSAIRGSIHFKVYDSREEAQRLNLAGNASMRIVNICPCRDFYGRGSTGHDLLGIDF